MSGVATQPPPPTTNGGPPSDGPDINGGPPGPQTNGPPGGPGPRGGPSVTAAQCQKMLDENSSLISTISEYQKMGRHNETMSYQVNCISDDVFFINFIHVLFLVATTPKPDAIGSNG